MTPHPVIIFDGICNLCCAWVQFLIWRDKKKRFRFSTLQSAYAKYSLESLGLETEKLETIVYIKGKQHFVESNAVLEIVKDLGGIWWIVGVFRLIPKFIRDHTYRFIAKSRYKVFGKRDSCLVPTPDLQKRFYL